MELRAELAELAERLRTQDNAITAEPVFTVEERRRHYGYDDRYVDDYVYISNDDSEDEVDRAEEPERFAALEEKWYAVAADRFQRVYYKDEWVFVQAFLTRAAAEAYRVAEAHNHKKTRVFVASGHRNPEWKRLRKLLGGELLDYIDALVRDRDEWRNACRRARGDV